MFSSCLHALTGKLLSGHSTRTWTGTHVYTHVRSHTAVIKPGRSFANKFVFIRTSSRILGLSLLLCVKEKVLFESINPAAQMLLICTTHRPFLPPTAHSSACSSLIGLCVFVFVWIWAYAPLPLPLGFLSPSLLCIKTPSPRCSLNNLARH